MRFGEALKQQRESRNISLEDISVSTRVSVRHLNALEAERYSDLPGGVFNKGIVRSYARFCGLDEQSTVDDFVQAQRDSGIEPELKDKDWVQFAEAVQRNRSHGTRDNRLQWLGVLAMIVAVVLLAVGVAWVLVHRGKLNLPSLRRNRSVATILRA